MARTEEKSTEPEAGAGKKKGSSLTKPGPEKRVRLEKNPEIKPPRRAKTAYLIFCDKHRPKIRESQSHLSMVDITKQLGQMWRAVSEAEKQECVKLAEKEQERHRKEQQEYFRKLKHQTPQTTVSQAMAVNMQQMMPMVQPMPVGSAPQAGVKQKKPRKPRSPPSAEQLYERKLRKELKSDFKKEETADKWKALSESERAPFIAGANAEQKTYEAKMADYNVNKQLLESQPPTPVAFSGPMVPQLHAQQFASVSAEDPSGTAPMSTLQQPLVFPTQLIDMDALRRSLRRVAVDEAYYKIIDCLRPTNTAMFGTACSAATHFIIGKKRPDLKGFLVTLFGLEEFETKLKKVKAPAQA